MELLSSEFEEVLHVAGRKMLNEGIEDKDIPLNEIYDVVAGKRARRTGIKLSTLRKGMTETKVDDVGPGGTASRRRRAVRGG